MPTNRSALISALVALLILIGLYCFIHYSDFSVSREIDPIGLASIAITVFFGVYLTRVIGKKDEQERIEKDALIAEVKEAKGQFSKDIRELVETESLDYGRAVQILKTHRQNIHFICECAREHGLLNDEQLLTKVMDKLKETLDLFTNTAPDGDGNEPGISVAENIIQIPQPRKTKIYSVLSEANRLLFDLVVAINRSSGVNS